LRQISVRDSRFLFDKPQRETARLSEPLQFDAELRGSHRQILGLPAHYFKNTSFLLDKVRKSLGP
jgi:hypothetical protein